MLRAILIGLVVFLAGCGSASTLQPPTPLGEFEETRTVETLWMTRIGGGVGEDFLRLLPVIRDGVVYSLDTRGKLFAMDLHTGKEIWRKILDDRISAGLSAGDGRLLLATSQGEVLMLDAKTGAEQWRATVSSEVLVPPKLADSRVVVRTVDGRLFGLDAATGRRLWVFESAVPVLTLRGTSAPAVDSGVVVAGFDAGKLVALTLSEGTPLWETVIAAPRGRTELERLVDIDGDPLIADGVIYVASYQGRVAAVAFDSGRVLWARDVSSFTDLAMDNKRLFLCTAEGEVWALDRRSGSVLWVQKQLRYRQLSAPVLDGDLVVVGDFDGYLHWLSADDGRFVARHRLSYIEDVFRQLEPPAFFDDFPERRDVLSTPVSAGELLLSVDRRGVIAATRLTAP